MDLKCLSQAHFKFDKKEKKWHNVPKIFSSGETNDEEQVFMLEGPCPAHKIDEEL